MKQHTPRPKNGRGYGAAVALLLCAAIFFGSAGIVGAQDNKKNKNKKDAPAPTNATPSMSEEQQIDYQISTMLGAWQVGDVEKLHTTYSDDVVFVSGNWAPPVVGWANYSTMYQQQRAHMQQVRMDRSNTLIKVDGMFGWACYQWDFSASFDGQASAARGQTTLILEKQNGHWVITHNHTSLVQSAGALASAQPTNPPPASQAPQK